MKKKQYNKMSMGELIVAYNTLAQSPGGKALGFLRSRHIFSFKNIDIAIKRCLALESSIRARRDYRKKG